MNDKNENIALKRILNARKNRDRYLDLSGLKLKRIPDEISKLDFLLELDLSYNCLIDFPTVLNKLDNLQFLNLSNNNLWEVIFEYGKYYSIIEINISHNNINFFPSDLLNLNCNTKIVFHDNPFLVGIPEEIVNQDDLNYIGFYLESLHKRDVQKRLYEVKVLMVGKGDVGKTTLMKVIDNPEIKIIVGKEDPTHGINILKSRKEIFFPAIKPFYFAHDNFEDLHLIDSVFEEDIEDDLEDTDSLITYTPFYEFYEYFESFDGLTDLRISDEPYYELEEKAYIPKEVNINFWDFGGQEILYSTHQFFLTKRSVYVFMWDPRTDSQEEDFDYWLNTIQRLSNNSPVLVVMSKSEVLFKSIDETNYKEKYPKIVGFYQVSCLTKKGINGLIENLNNTIRSLPHIGEALPSSWANIRSDFKKIKKDYLTYSDFKEICEIKDIKKLDYITEYLNDIGDIIYFNDDLRLKNFIILNPNWLTKAVYELIHELEIQRNHGLFNTNDLEKYLDKSEYPPEKYYEILSLMEKFEICFKIVGSNNLLRCTLSYLF